MKDFSIAMYNKTNCQRFTLTSRITAKPLSPKLLHPAVNLYALEVGNQQHTFRQRKDCVKPA